MQSRTGTRLRAGQVGLSGAVVQAGATIAPGAGAAFTVGAVAAHAGVAGPFTYLISLVPALALAVLVAEYARQMPAAGSFYVYLSNTFGPRTGFVAGTMLFAAYLPLIPFQVMFLGTFTRAFLAPYGVTIPWWVYSVALLLLSTTLVMRGVRVATRVSLLWLSFEVTVFTVLAVIVIAAGGHGGLSAKPFEPESSPNGFSGIVLASVFTLFAFTGFESATTLGEEVRQPRRTIPRAVIATTALIGTFFVLMSYAATIGFGTSAAHANRLAADPAPFTTLANRYVGGPMATLVSLAVIGSFVAVNIALMTATARILFAMGRDRLMPGWLGQVSGRGVPRTAPLVLASWGLIALIAGAALWGASDFEAWLSYVTTFFFIAAYLLLAFGVGVYYRRHHAEELRPIRHIVTPVVGLIGLGVVLYGNLHPAPPAPFKYLIWGAAATFAGAVAVAAWLGRRNPELVQRAGEVLAGLED